MNIFKFLVASTATSINIGSSKKTIPAPRSSHSTIHDPSWGPIGLLLIIFFASFAGLTPWVVATATSILGKGAIGTTTLGGLIIAMVLGTMLLTVLYIIYASVGKKNKVALPVHGLVTDPLPSNLQETEHDSPELRCLGHSNRSAKRYW